VLLRGVLEDAVDVALVILAAGIGSRYGGGIKQLAPVGPNGEPIIDYSICDAVAAGFNKIVFVIRRDIYNDFREVIGNKTEERFRQLGVKCEYVFQELVNAPEGRVKPWGTGQAVLSCADVLDGPFAVINADDYYGKGAFESAYKYLTALGDENRCGMIGYILENTFLGSGAVARGICDIHDGKLERIIETKNIIFDGITASAGDKIIPSDSVVSMNFWMFPKTFTDTLGELFIHFREELSSPLTEEFLLPTIVDGLIKAGKYVCDPIVTDARCFGVTRREDTKIVADALAQLV